MTGPDWGNGIRAVRSACAAVLAVLASIGSAVASGDLVTATAYGQLNFGAMQVDDGARRRPYFAANPSVPSRIGVRWEVPLAGPNRLTFQFETGLGLTNLSQVSPANDRLEIAFQRTTLRKFEVIYASATHGRLSFGQGSMASDGVAGTDLSRTGLAIGPAIGDLGGSTEFLMLDGTASGVQVGDVFDDLSGLRRFRVRYDTPTWQGVTISVAHGQEILRRGTAQRFTDAAVAYAFETETVQFEAVASYEWIGDVEERAVGSVALLHLPTGFNASVATGANRIGDGRYRFAKLGVVRDLARFGATALAVEYYEGDDFAGIGTRSRAIGLGLTQNIAALNLDLVAAVRRYEASVPAAPMMPKVRLRDVHVILVGARWQF